MLLPLPAQRQLATEWTSPPVQEARGPWLYLSCKTRLRHDEGVLFTENSPYSKKVLITELSKLLWYHCTPEASFYEAHPQVEMRGLEPLTSSLQRRRSPN